MFPVSSQYKCSNIQFTTIRCTMYRTIIYGLETSLYREQLLFFFFFSEEEEKKKERYCRDPKWARDRRFPPECPRLRGVFRRQPPRPHLASLVRREWDQEWRGCLCLGLNSCLFANPCRQVAESLNAGLAAAGPGPVCPRRATCGEAHRLACH